MYIYICCHRVLKCLVPCSLSPLCAHSLLHAHARALYSSPNLLNPPSHDVYVLSLSFCLSLSHSLSRALSLACSVNLHNYPLSLYSLSLYWLSLYSLPLHSLTLYWLFRAGQWETTTIEGEWVEGKWVEGEWVEEERIEEEWGWESERPTIEQPLTWVIYMSQTHLYSHDRAKPCNGTHHPVSRHFSRHTDPFPSCALHLLGLQCALWVHYVYYDILYIAMYIFCRYRYINMWKYI